MANNKQTRSKLPALITYIIGLVFLIAGLLLPISTASLVPDFDKMPVLQLGGALQTFGVPLTFGAALAPEYSYPVTLFGYSFDFGAALLLAYAFVAVVGIILLIPAICLKRKSSAARKLVVVAELIALTVLMPMSLIAFEYAAVAYNLSVLVPCGVMLLMLIIQSIIYMGGSGVMKTVLFVLTALSALFAVGNLLPLMPFAQSLQSVADMMNGSAPFNAVVGLYGVGEVPYTGMGLMYILLHLDALKPEGEIVMQVMGYAVLSLSLLVLLNLFLDAYGLGKRTNKFMLIANLVRYALEVALIIVLAITIAVAKGNYGLMLYLLLLIAVVQLVMQICRLAHYKHAVAADAVYAEDEDEDEDEEEDEDADVADSDDEYAFDDVPESKVAEATMAEPAEIKALTIVPETKPEPKPAMVYNGPMDDFIRKLTEEEKFEFSHIFLERSVESLKPLPDYIIGGDNAKFFVAVFIYLARVRDVVSDGLMNKLYKEVNMMK